MTETANHRPSLADGDPTVKPVKITMLGPGRAEILMHGVDIANDVAGFYLSAPSSSDLPELVLVMNGAHGSRAEFEGLARVMVGEQPDPGPAAVQFLSAIDGAELERAALNRDDLDSDAGGLTRAMLATLMDWASGRA